MAEKTGRERGNPARGYLYGRKKQAGKEETPQGGTYMAEKSRPGKRKLCEELMM